MKCLLFLLCGLTATTLVRCEDDLKTIAGQNILNYLNSNSEQIYRYKSIKSLEISDKNNGMYEFKTEIAVECLQDLHTPCLTKSFSCDGKLQTKENQSNSFEIISAFCNPEEVVTLESEDELMETATVQEVISSSISNDVGDQLPESTEEKPKICTGCLEAVNLKAEGVPVLLDTALKHIESERENAHRVLEVLQVYRQIVAGVKYIVILKVAPTTCPKDVSRVTENDCPILTETPYEYCKVEYLEQPWICKDKNIISNNCTKSQYFKVPKEFSDDGNKIDKNNEIEEMTPSRLNELESQLIEAKPKIDNSIPEESNTRVSSADKAFLDDFFGNTDLLTSSSVNPVAQNKEGDTSKSHETQDSKSAESNESFEDKKERLRRSLDRQVKGEKTSEESAESPESNGTSEEKRSKKVTKRAVKPDTSEESSESIDSSEEKRKGKKISERAIKRDTSEETSEESNDTSEELKRKASNLADKLIKHIDKRDTSETSEESTDKPDAKSSESVDSSEERERTKHKYHDEDNKLVRSRRGTRDSRAQSSLETTSDNPDISLDTIIKDHDKSEKSPGPLSAEEDSITRHKRGTKSNKNEDDDDSSSSSSSSSSDDDDDDNNNNNNNNNKHKESNNNGKNCSNDSSDDSSDSDSDDCDDDNDNGNNNHKSSKKRRSRRSVYLSKKQTNNLIRNLAEIAVASLDDIDDDNLRRVILKIEDVQTTQLEGTIYQLTLKTALSNCKETKEDLSRRNLLKRHKDDEKECAEDIKPHSVKTCKVQIHVNEQHTSPKVLKSECSRRKRSSQQMTGGVSDVSTDDKEIVDLVDSSLTLLDGSSGHENKYKVVEITSANQQVVAGMKYTISVKIQLSDCPKSDSKAAKDCGVSRDSNVENCKIVIWDRPWLKNGRETTFTCGNRQPQLFRSRRSVLVGGAQPLSTDDPTVQELVEHTLTHLDRKSLLETKYKATDVVSAKVQVVAGRLYTIEIKVAPSDCLKTETKSRDECGVSLKESEPTLCVVRIWDRPWLKNGRETNVTCGEDLVHSFRTKRSIDQLGRDRFATHLNYFREFQQKFGKFYHTKSEELRRFRVFRKNLAKIDELNDLEKGTAIYGITKFADLTYDEFRRRHTGLRPDLRRENEIPLGDAEIPDIELPDEFDWRTKGVVTGVKDQQQCGSCWAFSVTGNVEGQYAIKHNDLLSLSEQELVDCDKSDDGCGGGLMDNAYRAIEQLGGLETETDYPYDAEDEKCHFNKTLARVQLSGAVNISQDEDDMAKWLTQNGPISIAINANAMQFYVGGVSHPYKFLCNPKDLDHGVLIVGYGVHTYKLFHKTLPFWIVKNSWGTSWGEQGYYRVYRGDGTCGLNQTPSSAIVV